MNTGPNFGSKDVALVILSCALQQHTLNSTCFVLQGTAAVLFSGRISQQLHFLHCKNAYVNASTSRHQQPWHTLVVVVTVVTVVVTVLRRVNEIHLVKVVYR